MDIDVVCVRPPEVDPDHISDAVEICRRKNAVPFPPLPEKPASDEQTARTLQSILDHMPWARRVIYVAEQPPPKGFKTKVTHCPPDKVLDNDQRPFGPELGYGYDLTPLICALDRIRGLAERFVFVRAGIEMPPDLEQRQLFTPKEGRPSVWYSPHHLAQTRLGDSLHRLAVYNARAILVRDRIDLGRARGARFLVPGVLPATRTFWAQTRERYLEQIFHLFCPLRTSYSVDYPSLVGYRAICLRKATGRQAPNDVEDADYPRVALPPPEPVEETAAA